MDPTNIALYTVKPGDTLERIAYKLGVSTHALLCLNYFSPSEILVTGQTILIPSVRKTIVSLGFFQLGDLSGLRQTITKIGPLFTYGGIFQFPVTTAGTIQITDEESVTDAVNLLKSCNILPLMTLTNLGPEKFDPDLASAVIRDETVKAQLMINLAILLELYHFGGVNIDFENVSPADRTFFTDFIRDLKLNLGARGYLISVTVPPKASDIPDEIGKGAYDYFDLGQWADFIFIMTYDWGHLGSPPMPVAPINEVQKVLDYATTQIPSKLILQGIPLYGYNWQLPYMPDSPVTVVNLMEVYEIARRYHATIQFDPVAQSPNFNYRDQDGNDHIVWFEDTRSLQTKYQAARDMNLGGVGFWYGKNTPYGLPQGWVLFNEMFVIIKELF